MLRDNLAGLIEPMLDSAGAHDSRAVPGQKRGMLQVDRLANRRSWAILAQNFCLPNGRTSKKAIWPLLASNPEAHDSRAVCSQLLESHRKIDPQCLENPYHERLESTLTGNASSPFPAEPRQ